MILGAKQSKEIYIKDIMKHLLTLFTIVCFVSGQNSDLYKRPFNGKPDFDIDVLHYEIDLKINDHEKSF